MCSVTAFGVSVNEVKSRGETESNGSNSWPVVVEVGGVGVLAEEVVELKRADDAKEIMQDRCAEVDCRIDGRFDGWVRIDES